MKQEHKRSPNLERMATLVVPGERHLKAGRSLDGRIWMQIDDQPRVVVPAYKVATYATELLRLCGVTVVIESIDEQAANLSS